MATHSPAFPSDKDQKSPSDEQIRVYLAGLEQAETTVSQRSYGLIQACEQFVEEQTRYLSHLKKEMQMAMNAAVTEAKSCIGDWETQKLGDLAEVVTGKRYRGDPLVLFKYEEKWQNCCFPDLLGVHWQTSSPALSTDPVSPSKSANPLLYSDIDAYISAMTQIKAETALCDLQAEYYKAHFDCFQSKEKAYFASLQDLNTSESLEKWTQRGLERLERGLNWPVSDEIRKDLEQRLACAYAAICQSAESRRNGEELKAEKALPAPELGGNQGFERKKRGRPPKRGSFGKDLEASRKNKRGKSRVFLVETHTAAFETETPWEGQGKLTESSPEEAKSL